MKCLWILALAACATAPSVDRGVPVREAYGESSLNMSITDSSPLAARKEIPVIYPPEVFAVYVPAQVSRKRDILIGDHWVFLKLKEGGWFPEKLDEDLRSQQAAGEGDVELARKKLSGARFVVPHE